MLKILVPEHVACLGTPQELRIPFNGNHFEISKFVSPESTDYRVVSSILAKLIREVSGSKGEDVIPNTAYVLLTSCH
jgi:hypothetical protein